MSGQKFQSPYAANVDRGACATPTQGNEDMNLVKHNRDVYITQKLDGAHGNGASGIVVGAPSSGTRYLQRKQEEIGQAQFWNQAQPVRISPSH